MNDLFEEKVLRVVAQVPLGRVVTYGQIAQLIGYPRHARQVGKVLATSTKDVAYPCHRVVTSTGVAWLLIGKSKARFSGQKG